MKSQLKIRTKLSEDEEKQVLSVNKRIRELKKLYTKKVFGHISEVYKILDEIVRLKKYSNPRYAPRSLEWEEDLNINAQQIRYVFAYKDICKYAQEKVDEGLIDDSTICHFLATSSILREEYWQKKLIDKLLKKQIKIGEVSELTQNELKLFLQDKLTLRTSDKYFFTATKTLRSILKRLRDRSNLLEKSPFKDNLYNAIISLNELILSEK